MLLGCWAGRGGACQCCHHSTRQAQLACQPLVGIGALLIPGIGPIVAAGALATTLGGAALGAAAGGLLGALVGLGIPEEDAQGYEESVRQGSILLTVTTDSDEQAQAARAIFDQQGGGSVRSYGVGDAVTT